MNLLKRLFRRKKPETELTRPIEPAGPKPGFDIIGRQGGQKRNRVHIYRQPYGYPIRLCDWVAVDTVEIEEVGQCMGKDGPAESATLVMALGWRESMGERVCRHCQAVAAGKRACIGMIYHGHGKGAH